MPNEVIRVISSEMDGAQLSREKAKNPLFVRCDGKADDAEINEALTSAHRGRLFSIPSEAWERIFGRERTA